MHRLLRHRHWPRDCQLNLFQVIRRVAEMKALVADAEQYLVEGETTDAESVVTERSESELSSNYGKLKHSDSLLLLNPVRYPLWLFDPVMEKPLTLI